MNVLSFVSNDFEHKMGHNVQLTSLKHQFFEALFQEK